MYSQHQMRSPQPSQTHVVSGENDLDAAPVGVFGDLLRDEVLELCREPRHEWRPCIAKTVSPAHSEPDSIRIRLRARPQTHTLRRTWGDAVAIETLSLGDYFALALGLVDELLHLLRGPEASAALLVHLGTRGDAVDGEEEELLRLDDREQVRDVREHGEEDGLLRDAERGVVVVRVRAAAWRGSARSPTAAGTGRRTCG